MQAGPVVPTVALSAGQSQPQKPKGRSRSGLTQLAVASATLLMGVAAYFSYQAVRNLMLGNLQNNALLEVQLSVDTLDQWLLQTKTEIATIAKTPALQSMDWSQAGPYLKAEVENLQDFYYMAMIYPNGEYYTTKVDQAVGQNIRDRAHVKAAMAGRTFVSDPVSSRTLEGQVIVAVTAPVRQKDDQPPLGVLAGLIDLKQLNTVVGALTYGEDSYALALNAEGMPIAHPNPKLVGTLNEKTPSLLASEEADLVAIAGQMVEKNQGIEKIQLEGESVYVAYFPLEQANWSIALVIPEVNIESQLKFLNTIALLVGLLTTAILAILWWVQRLEHRQLEQSKVLADGANRAKSEFLANMSHELRTPLNGILGYVHILRRSEALSQSDKKGLGIIHQCGHHLLMLINDVLDLAKIEARKLELYPDVFHLPAFVQSVAEICQVQAASKEIEFICEAETLPVSATADEKRLRQVLINLLSNAIKFTDAGQVTLRVLWLNPGETCDRYRLRFEIQDTGVGLTPEQINKICLPFEQVGEKTRQQAGTGLGLAITTQILQIMGSQLQIDSQLGVGSTFSFEVALPAGQAWSEANLANAPAQPMGYHGDRRTLLIVDDRWENRSMLLSLLEPLGFKIVEAVNGQQALAQIQQMPPDGIITDLVMPVMDGLALIKQVRSHPAWQMLPIIVCSASVFEADRHQSLDRGANEFLPKPIQATALLNALQTALNLEWLYPPPPSSEVTEPTEFGEAVATVAETSVAETSPPVETLQQLMVLARKGDLDRLIQIAQQLDAPFQDFAAPVIALAEGFQLKPLMTFLEEAIQNKK